VIRRLMTDKPVRLVKSDPVMMRTQLAAAHAGL